MLEHIIYFICIVIFSIPVYIAYKKKHNKKITLTLLTCIGLNIILYIGDTPGQYLDGVIYGMVTLFVILPVYIMTIVVWVITIIMNKKKRV